MKKALIATIVTVIVVVVVMAMIFALPGQDDNGDNGDVRTITFYGVEFSWEQLEGNFTAKTIGDRTGFPLGDIMNSTAFSQKNSDDQNKTMFRITADDGWTKNVSWMDLQTGIIMETDLATYFPNLPGAFRVKNVASVNDIPLGPIMFLKVGGTMADNHEATWSNLAANVDEVTIVVGGSDTQAMSLVAALEYAGFTGLENATITIEGVDGYSKEVNWTQAQAGYLIEDGMRSYFDGLPGSYRVRNVIRVWVEY